jgi:hypothetical protein
LAINTLATLLVKFTAGEPVYQTTDEVFDKVDEIGTQLLGKRISGNLPLTEWAKEHGILLNEPQMRIYV